VPGMKILKKLGTNCVNKDILKSKCSGEESVKNQLQSNLCQRMEHLFSSAETIGKMNMSHKHWQINMTFGYTHYIFPDHMSLLNLKIHLKKHYMKQHSLQHFLARHNSQL